MRKVLLFLLLMVFVSSNLVFGQVRGKSPQQEERKARLVKLAKKYKEKARLRKEEAIKEANEKGWIVRQENVEGVMEIQYLDQFGMPQYNTTMNRNAARTINTDDLWTGGSSGLDLDGSGFTIGEWDGGGIRLSHQEFDGRVTQQDAPASTSSHSTHVAGTLVAEGQNAAARGMAFNANLDAYDWDDDLAEMTLAASNGMTVSNHSYGKIRGWSWNSGASVWMWYGNISISTTEDYLFGFYDVNSQDVDNLVFNAPTYLPVWAAANDRNDSHVGGHYVFSGGAWVWSTAARDADGGADGYDCLPQGSVAKNILTVGAVEDIVGGWTNPADVVMSSFSSWGPTDDGRIKPDLSANGVGLTSCNNTGDAAYTPKDGTSMAAPSVTGTLALLQNYYQSLNGGQMSAAALKGLAINTVNEAGPNPGPDYMFGHGLMDATKAADLITLDNTEGGLIVEGILESGQTTDFTYYSDGLSDINITLCWTDPAGTPPAASLNPVDLMLVNDLDVKVIDENLNISYPWSLNPVSPANAATNSGKNWRDNVEVVNIPSPTAGYYTVRIDHDGVMTGTEQAYALIISGMSTAPTNSYCDVEHTSWGTFEYIENVSFGDINNSTGRSVGGYGDYSGLVTTMNKGDTEMLTVDVNGYLGDYSRVWVDWNQDGDFLDANEAIDLGTGAGPYSVNITVPATALLGYTKMRIRLKFNGGYPDPCGSLTYGETEDYAINIVGVAGLWIGVHSTDWDNPLNWDDNNVPTNLTDVVIPSGTPFQPTIGSGVHAFCNDLTIQAGATLSQAASSFFYVDGDFDSDNGTFTQLGITYLYFTGTNSSSWDDDNEDDTYYDIRINKGVSTAQVTMWQDMTVLHSFSIREGKFAIDATWQLNVNGAASNTFEVQDGGTMVLENQSINVPSGSFEFEDGSNVIVTGGTMYCGKDFNIFPNAANDLDFSGSTLVMNGNGGQSISDHDGGTTFHNVSIAKGGGVCSLNINDLTMTGDMLISGGTLNPNSLNITVGGDWTNTVGDAGFDQSTGRVIFNAAGHQYCSDEIFNELEIDKPSGALRMNGTDVVCAAYDWTDGSIDVLPGGGSFTANDLLDNAIQGGFYLNPGGTINLINDGGFVDLKGDVHIFGGTMSVTGIASWWPYQEDASIEMSGGVLDFTNCGILIKNTPHNLTDNITGGTIKSAGGFIGNRADFTPANGTFEFYGGSNVTLSETNGCTLASVKINKASKAAVIIPIEKDGRIDETIIVGKVNASLLGSDFTITDDLDIIAGSLGAGVHDLYVGGDWTNNVGSGGFLAGSGTVIFNGSSAKDINTDETFYNMALDKTYGGYNGLEFDANINVHILNNLNIIDGSIEMNANSTLDVDGDVDIALNAGLNVNDLGVELSIGGDWTNNNISWNTSGLGYRYGNEIITFDGNSDQILTTSAPREEFGNLVINKSGGEFKPNATMDITGDLLITDGSWNDNVNGITHYFEGDVQVDNDANFFGIGTTVVFKTASDQNITFLSNSYFTDVIIDKSDWTSKSPIGDGKGEPETIPESKDPTSMVHLLTDLRIQGGLTIDEGILDLNGNSFKALTNIDINSGGTLSMDEGSLLGIHDGESLNVNTGGSFVALGTAGNNATVTRFNSTGYYGFSVNSGGYIAAEHTTFEFIEDTQGLSVASGATVEPTMAFNYCTFRNSKPGLGGMLFLGSEQALTCTNLTFEDNGTAFNVGVPFSPANDVTMVAAEGDYAGPEFEFDSNGHLHWTDIDVELDLTVLLEGAYNGVDMDTDLRTAGVLPLSQPFNVYPYNYAGAESVAVIPADVVDWVLIELRDSDDPSNADAASIIEQRAAFLLADGSIVDLDGSSPLNFTTTYTDKLFPVVLHLNHLAVISSTNIIRSGGVYAYDFTTGSYGGVTGQKEVSAGVWAMYAGDGSGDGTITVAGDVLQWKSNAGEDGYLYGDYNMDSHQDNKDKNDICFPNIGESSQVNQPQKGAVSGKTRFEK